MNAPLAIETLGDSALLLQFGEHIDAELSAQVHAAARAIAALQLPGIVELVPAYASLAVVFDPAVWQGEDALPAQRCRHVLERCFAASPVEEPTATPLVEIPVCYGGESGPDLPEAAQRAGLTPEEFAARHASSEYRVAMLGFAPGFPYLLGLDPALQQPRRATPRVRVPVGSVAIGGAQTGIYPRELPGGWALIGRTPLGLFDQHLTPPNRLAPGMRVRFVAIGPAEFAAATPRA